jgi:hypothetical protein
MKTARRPSGETLEFAGASLAAFVLAGAQL